MFKWVEGLLPFLTLIKTTLASIPIHYLSLLVLPKSVCNVMEKFQRDFLWRKGDENGGMHLVAWDRICSPKEKGGAGLRGLEAMSKALLCKWLWRFGDEEGSLWKHVVSTKFEIEDGWDLMHHQGSYGRSPWM